MTLSDLADVPQAVLKVAATITYSEQVIAPLLNEFMQKYPALKLQLILSNKTLDPITENIDLAIRIGHLEYSTMMAKKLTQRQLCVCVPPA